MVTNPPGPISNSRLRRVRATFTATLVSSVVALSLVRTAAAQGTASEAGVWIDHTGQGAVEIAPCGNRLCGHIFWLKEPNAPKGGPLVDIYNPDSSKRKRTICGLPILGNLQRQPGGAWDAGWVYDPKDGKKYDLEIRSAGRDRLTVTGYMGSKFFGKSMTWTRAPRSLPRCGTAPQTAGGNAPQPKDGARAAPAGRPAASAAVAPSAPDAPHGRPTPIAKVVGPVGAAATMPGAMATSPAAPGSAPLSTGAAGIDRFAEPVLIAGPVPARQGSAPGEPRADKTAPNAPASPPERAQAETDPLIPTPPTP